MKNSVSNTDSVASVKGPAQIEVSGFEYADDSVHMIEWLGKGSDFRQFIANDIETELYAQDQGSQLLSVNCVAKPEYETKLLRQDDISQKAILAQISVTFPLTLRVRATNGVVWNLKVKHNYHAMNLDVPGKHKLKLNFTIIAQLAE